MKLNEKLRKAILEIRRKPYPISDLIPMLDECATTLERQEQTLRYEIDLCEQAIRSRQRMNDFMYDICSQCPEDIQTKFDNFFKGECNK